MTQKPFQHIQIVICVVNTRFGILQRHSGEELFQHIIIVIGVVNYMIPDKVLGHIAEKPVQHILTVIPTGPVNPVYSSSNIYFERGIYKTRQLQIERNIGIFTITT